MTYSTVVGGTTIATASGVTTVECHKQVRSWRLLRYLMHLLIPSCNCSSLIEGKETTIKEDLHNHYQQQPTFSSSPNIITGTIFGYRHGKVRFCIQTNSKSINNPILLLEFAIPTTILAKEMQGGVLRLALECNSTLDDHHVSLLSMPVWTMYCNGRKVGYAIKRKISKTDMEVLKVMDSVVVGAGIITTNKNELDHEDDQVIYLRASFQRVYGSSDSESYHLIDPDGNIGQELSIFFYRSR
ncbi:hypothetical protein LWI28_000919 [Acer negundo]|uniref:Protein MIZU-KUSSEI 1-like n=1 Tax=Acer negundo TaxID=4023 RepID=A0AAD5IH36_ACENE|nr:hypothetical protein LWI28_000919 [Acer negundo]KAK4844739.1 hypothetical protein QYF36_023858 [Acer negundo]